jgi:tRNA(fMet)-specific endonuclease VapC
MAILDTTVLIDLARGKSADASRRARADVARRLAAGQALATTRINEAEFRVGVMRAKNPARELAAVEAVLSILPILEFDQSAAVCFARIKASLLDRGTPIGDMDALIASIAISTGQTLVTRNPRHFHGIVGLSVESY